REDRREEIEDLMAVLRILELDRLGRMSDVLEKPDSLRPFRDFRGRDRMRGRKEPVVLAVDEENRRVGLRELRERIDRGKRQRADSAHGEPQRATALVEIRLEHVELRGGQGEVFA